MNRPFMALLIAALSVAGFAAPTPGQQAPLGSPDKAISDGHVEQIKNSVEKFMEHHPKDKASIRLFKDHQSTEFKGRIVEVQDSALVIEEKKGAQRHVVAFADIAEGPTRIAPLEESIAVDTLLVLAIIPCFPLLLLAGIFGWSDC